jgi:hypothetical protein
MAENNRSSVTPLLITGILAILGTVAGGVIKGYWDNKLAQQEFQTDLVMRALEPDDEQSRVNALRFMVDTRLIDNPELGEALTKYLDDESKTLPQFTPAGGGAAGVVVPRTPDTAGSTDYDIFVCADAWESGSAHSMAVEIVEALRTSVPVGEIRRREWDLYNEVPLDTLMNKTTIILDEGERGELPGLEKALAGVPSLPTLQVLPNTGSPTLWRISVILCPSS